LISIRINETLWMDFIVVNINNKGSGAGTDHVKVVISQGQIV